MATPTEVAEAHYVAQSRQGEAAAVVARRLWRQVDADDLDRSWAQIVRRLTLAVGAAQLGAARAGAAYVPLVLDAAGADPEVDGELNPNRWAGVASDGRPLDSLLFSSVVRVRQGFGAGKAPREALDGGRKWLEALTRTQVADAGRGATGAAIAARKGVGYVRLVSAPCCQRCAVLAGKTFKWNDGFARHPKCFPAGVSVSGSDVSAATRRWYEGELVVLSTASGQNLPLTGNHPVLTRRGWVPAHFLQECDEVIRSTRPQGATPLVVPDHHQVPALIEDVWGSFRVCGFERVPTSPEDFHGDGQQGEVDVVYADRALRSRPDALAAKKEIEEFFPIGVMGSAGFHLECVAELLNLRSLALAGGSVSSSSPSLSFLGSGPLGANLGGLALSAALHPGLAQDFGDRVSGDAEAVGQFQHRNARFVEFDGFGPRDYNGPGARWDAPDLPFPEQAGVGYASVGLDLLERLSGQVERDRLVEVRRVDWSGHVFSLSTDEGWHSANSLIVSNCDCRHVPQSEDHPSGYKADISPDEVKDLTEDQRKAISDGADMNQVINAHRKGRRSADGMTTSEGVTRRGLAGQRLRGQRRLTPEAVYRVSATREEAVDLLRRHGYLI